MATSGIHVAIELEADGQSIRIVAVNEGGQLAKQVKILDRLVSVNGTSVSGKTTEEAMILLAGAEGSDITLAFSRPADAAAGQKSLKIVRTTSPDIDRQVASMTQIKDMMASETKSQEIESIKTNYWRSAKTPDGKLFAEICDSIQDLKSKSKDNGFLGLGAVWHAIMDKPVQMMFGRGAPPAGSSSSGEDVVPAPQPQEGHFTQLLVLRLAAGDFFGEIALLSDKPRQATVKAFGSVTVLVMSRDAFTRLCGPLMNILRRNLDNYENIELPSPDEVPGPGAEKSGAHISFGETSEIVEQTEETVERKPRTSRQRRKSVYVESVSLEADWEPPYFEKEEEEKKRLSEHISKTALLAALDTKARDTVIGAVQKQLVKKDEDVIVQGEAGDYFYILDVGACDVFIKKPDGSELKVLQYAAGGSFGELALLHGEPRLATVRATAPSTVWKLDRDTFRKIMMSTGKQSMDERTKFLNKVSILSDLSTFEKFKVAESMEVRYYKDEDIIVEEGDEGNDFFIIETGSCHCFKKHLDI